ncbi:aquaporin Z [Gordonia hirsuta DSM 44140 = NBRC 16056]|uniref:Aquaporin Z n=1 Tax=Gordonia hirsuta DSM 44140 = NBRC 16056 TaxID=1121927 RepID=L7LBQ4_9ACTN|nr:aquaporin Z [Gordonia hirsuta]GAC58364.1 aquaporin Z [Gordonia hirsuta DSM 44140 = NBRC 16056]
MRTDSIAAKWLAELFGTFWLVFGGCGSAVFAAKVLVDGDGVVGSFNIGIGFVGVALAFGLTVLTMIYAVGWISGGHFNPAVTIGAAASGRFPWKDVPGYWISQVIGGLLAGLAIYVIASGQPGWEATGNMAANGYGDNSPGLYSMAAVALAEVILTAFFVIIILGATHGRAPVGFAGLAIGLALTLIHLISIPISNTSVNPARSTGVAFFNGAGAPGQLWLFWLAPLVGGLIGGVLFPLLWEKTPFARPDIIGEAEPVQ